MGKKSLPRRASLDQAARIMENRFKTERLSPSGRIHAELWGNGEPLTVALWFDLDTPMEKIVERIRQIKQEAKKAGRVIPDPGSSHKFKLSVFAHQIKKLKAELGKAMPRQPEPAGSADPRKNLAFWHSLTEYLNPQSKPDFTTGRVTNDPNSFDIDKFLEEYAPPIRSAPPSKTRIDKLDEWKRDIRESGVDMPGLIPIGTYMDFKRRKSIGESKRGQRYRRSRASFPREVWLYVRNESERMKPTYDVEDERLRELCIRYTQERDNNSGWPALKGARLKRIAECPTYKKCLKYIHHSSK